MNTTHVIVLLAASALATSCLLPVGYVRQAPINWDRRLPVIGVNDWNGNHYLKHGGDDGKYN